MTRSLPGLPDQQLKAGRLSERLQSLATSVGLKVIPWVPTGAKRLLSGGRSVIIDGNTLDPTLQLALSGLRAFGLNGLVLDGDVAVSRASLREMTNGFAGPQIHVGVNEVSIPGPAGPIRTRHYHPATSAPAPLVVFYHGGGWVIGDLDTHDPLCRLTCRDADVHVLSIDYRLAPEHAAPAAADDAYAAFQWAYEHAADLGAIPGKVAVGGDSAGGNLAAVVSQRARDEGGPAPVLQWLIYPRTDFTAKTRSLSLFADGFLLTKADIDFFTEQYLGGSGVDPADPRVSPLLAGSLSGLPPALVATAGFDPLRDEGNLYAAALREAGTPVDLRTFGALTHGFASLFPLGGGSAVATTELISALRAHLSRV
ncbi:lipase/esterase LipN [Mycobacterium cookii]|uniref:Lipase n=1 Tax=Mycobacterium cookii TaxID=1775 RepID=A0A7I7L5B1_9MYCO|nr:alpha/beta hydrolase [Mycobacterium cookii]MCV7329221.1 alpha/beta hydrolase [Mycobacterium cookii]BBX48948.1 lipase [Mycobacterium cookii]